MNTNEAIARNGRSDRLGQLFLVVAVLETGYAALGLLTPPALVGALTGWDLSPDGQWILKLLGTALAAQAWTAWALRDSPHRGVAAALAFYQLASATVDVLCWSMLDGAFAAGLARMWLMVAIPSHYLLGALLLVALRRMPRAPRSGPGAAS